MEKKLNHWDETFILVKMSEDKTHLILKPICVCDDESELMGQLEILESADPNTDYKIVKAARL